MLKLYHGGCGTLTAYVVARTAEEAAEKFTEQSGIDYLPVEITEISVDGAVITVTESAREDGGEAVEPDRKNAEVSEPISRAEGSRKPARRANRARKKSD